MNYSEIISELNKASSFDLYRLQIAISQELANPQRIDAIKEQLKVGQKVSYFDGAENRLVDAVVVEIRRTRCLLENTSDGKRWTMPFSHINLAGVDTDIRNKKRPLGIEKHELKVGDKVGFKDRDNNDLYGRVIRLNQKTATIDVPPKQQWRVAYSFLFFVIDGEKGREQEYIPNRA